MARKRTGVPDGITPGAPASRLPAVVKDDRTPLPWERQKGESAKAFWAFEHYRELGPTRSLRKVQEIAVETQAVGPTMIDRWSSQWRWVDRVESWDLDQARRRAAESDRARAEAARTRAVAGSSLLSLGLRRLRGDAQAEGGPIAALDPRELDVWAVVRSIEVGSKLQAEALGEGIGLAGADPVVRRQVQALVRDLLETAMLRIEEAARAAVTANGGLDALIENQKDVLVEEAEAIFLRAVTR